MYQSNLTSSLDQLALVSRRALAHIQPLVVELVGEINNRMGVKGGTGSYLLATDEEGEGSGSCGSGGIIFGGAGGGHLVE